jgi:hypothetical protein
MTDYQIEANSRRCTLTGRELQPGERVYSVLTEEGGKLQRRDYSREAWQGPPPGAFGFWVGRVPVGDEKARPRIDDEMLMECFQRLEADGHPDRLRFRYIIALLLMRRKRLKFEEAQNVGEDEVLFLRCVRTREQYRVVNPRLTEEEMAAVQDEVFKVLGWQ